MHRTPIALLMLLAGVAIGALIGFTVGSGNAVQPDVVAAGYSGIERPAAPAAPGLGPGQNPTTIDRAGGARSALEADLERPGAASLDPSSPNGKMASGIAKEAEREAQLASAGEVVDVDPIRAITGIVLDHRGQPLAGVTVTTQISAGASEVRTRSRTSIGRGWKGETDLAKSLQVEAASTLEQRRLRRVAVSDAEGRFALTNLGAGKLYLRAYAEGYVFRGRSVYVGSSATFTGKPAELFHLEVVDGEDAAIERAIIGVHNNDQWTYYDWSADEPRLPLDQRSASLKAFAGGPLLGDDDDPFSKLSSEQRLVHLDVDGAGPHRFKVKPTRSLCISVLDETTDGPTLPHTVRYADAKKLEDSGGRTEFKRNSFTLRMDGDGRYRVASLAKGDYVIGVGRGPDEPEVFREFSMAEGPVEETILLPPVSTDDFLIVEAYNPSGVALAGLTFSLWAEKDGRVRSHKLSSTMRGASEHWVGKLQDVSYWEGPTKLAVKSPAYGTLITPIARDQGTLRVDFLEPCNLRVNVAADEDKMFQVSLFVKESLGGKASSTLVSEGPKPTKGQGFVIFRGLQPGLAELTLHKKGDSRWRSSTPKLALAEVPLQSGEQVAVLSATTLHTLQIHAPGESPGTQFTASALSGEGSSGLGGRASGRLDDDRMTRLTKLPPGRYSLRTSGGRSPAVEVTVPSSALTYERPATVGYRVSARRKGRDIAPLVLDDIITEVNGDSVAVGSLTSRISLAVAEGTATLTVLRDGESLALPIQTYPRNASYTPIATFD